MDPNEKINWDQNILDLGKKACRRLVEHPSSKMVPDSTRFSKIQIVARLRPENHWMFLMLKICNV